MLSSSLSTSSSSSSPQGSAQRSLVWQPLLSRRGGARGAHPLWRGQQLLLQCWWEVFHCFKINLCWKLFENTSGKEWEWVLWVRRPLLNLESRLERRGRPGWGSRDHQGGPMFSWQVRQSLETVLSSWPRETTHGFLQHFTTRFSFIYSGLTAYRQDFTPPFSRQMNVVSEYSTIDSTILVGLTHNPNLEFWHLHLQNWISLSKTLGALFAGNYFGGEVCIKKKTKLD